MHIMSYPGTYRPTFTGKADKSPSSEPLKQWEVLHHAGEVVIRCWIPGVKREDIELTIRHHRIHLSVYSALPRLDGECCSSIRYCQEIPLPPDADTTWYAAEYHRGLLTIQFPTAAFPALNGISRVVVY
jgi:HSP20 family molecular chaperone IbpA